MDTKKLVEQRRAWADLSTSAVIPPMQPVKWPTEAAAAGVRAYMGPSARALAELLVSAFPEQTWRVEADNNGGEWALGTFSLTCTDGPPIDLDGGQEGRIVVVMEQQIALAHRILEDIVGRVNSGDRDTIGIEISHRDLGWLYPHTNFPVSVCWRFAVTCERITCAISSGVMDSIEEQVFVEELTAAEREQGQ